MENAAPYCTVYTIGHSTHAIEVFIAMLRERNIEVLADIRSFPGSRKFPQYNKAALAASLKEAGIEYLQFPDLGGKRPAPASLPKQPFGGYVAYMQTDAFAIAARQLQQLAQEKKLVYMCSEVLWWQCHRSMVSDYLKANGWRVLHIMGIGKMQEHFRPGDEKQLQGKLF
jgi:uncharacterized protein (DUF488 family)